MKKVFVILGLCSVLAVMSACTRTCEVEPIVEQNHKLIVPKNFGAKPTK